MSTARHSATLPHRISYDTSLPRPQVPDHAQGRTAPQRLRDVLADPAHQFAASVPLALATVALLVLTGASTSWWLFTLLSVTALLLRAARADEADLRAWGFYGPADPVEGASGDLWRGVLIAGPWGWLAVRAQHTGDWSHLWRSAWAVWTLGLLGGALLLTLPG